MGSRGGKGVDAVDVQLSVLRIGLLFIVTSVRGDSAMIGFYLRRENISLEGSNTLIISG